MRATLSELAEIVGGEAIGTGAGDSGGDDVILSGLAPLSSAGPSDLSFLSSRRYLPQLADSSAGAVLVGTALFDAGFEPDRPAIRVGDPYFAFLTLLERFHPRRHPSWGIDARADVAETAALGGGVHIGPFAVVSDGAKIGDGVVVYPGAFVGEECEIGDRSVLFANVSLYGRTRVGSDVIIHSGAVLGADGFGYHPRPDGSFHKIPQIGRVVIEDGVEIGANACVDRAMMGDTVIGSGTKLDNLVQIAHNCSVGPHCVLAGQAGLSGSVTVGAHVQIGGQVGVSDHVTIGSGSALMAQSGIASDVEEGSKVFGSPAVPSRQFMRAHLYTQRLGELFGQVERLERRVRELEGGD